MGQRVDEPAADFLPSRRAALRVVFDRCAQPPALARAGRLTGSWRVGRPGAVLVDEPPLLLWRVPRVAAWDRFVIRHTARRWRRLAGPREAGPLIAYVFHPKFWPYIDETSNPDHLVYHAYDLFERTRGWSTKLDLFQGLLCQKADLVVSSSQAIADVLESRYGRVPTVIGNGVDYDAFVAADSGGPEPADLLAIPRPRIGYTGGLSRKVDFELVTTIARRRRQWHFVFMGEVRSLDGPSATAMAEAEAQPNVHFLAPKPHEIVPAYVCAMDVNIMCYRLSDDLWIEGIYPLKLHEYLAAGRPIVSADVPSVRPFADVVAIARDADQWERALESALSNGEPGSLLGRRQVAAANSWTARVDQLEAELLTLTSRSKSEREQARVISSYVSG